jgi:hypothetical protein
MQKVTTGTLTSASTTVDADASDFENFIVQLSGTWSGQIEIQGTVDGTNYRALHVVDMSDNGGYGYLQLTTNGIWCIMAQAIPSILGLQKLRVKFTTYTSGTANVTVVLASGAK